MKARDCFHRWQTCCIFSLFFYLELKFSAVAMVTFYRQRSELSSKLRFMLWCKFKEGIISKEVWWKRPFFLTQRDGVLMGEGSRTKMTKNLCTTWAASTQLTLNQQEATQSNQKMTLKLGENKHRDTTQNTKHNLQTHTGWKRNQNKVPHPHTKPPSELRVTFLGQSLWGGLKHSMCSPWNKLGPILWFCVAVQFSVTHSSCTAKTSAEKSQKNANYCLTM